LGIFCQANCFSCWLERGRDLYIGFISAFWIMFGIDVQVGGGGGIGGSVV
jgi:hypothetical protein